MSKKRFTNKKVSEINIVDSISPVGRLRKLWLKKGYELINITTLCKCSLGTSGFCNGFNEPEETIHHLQLWYRDEQVAVINVKGSYVVDEDKYLLWTTSVDKITGNNFIIFRKVKL